MTYRLPADHYSIIDGNGDPRSGAKLETYITETSTPLATYSDEALSIANANPVIANSEGRFPDIWLLEQKYKMILKDSADVTVKTTDPVYGPGQTGSEFTAAQTTLLNNTYITSAGNVDDLADTVTDNTPIAGGADILRHEQTRWDAAENWEIYPTGHDDFVSRASNDTKIAAAITAASGLIFQPKSYPFSAEILLDTYCGLRGTNDGDGTSGGGSATTDGTILDFDSIIAGDAGIRVEFTGAGVSPISGPVIEDLRLEYTDTGHGTSGGGADGMVIATKCRVLNVSVREFNGWAFDVTPKTGTTLTNARLASLNGYQCGNGINFSGKICNLIGELLQFSEPIDTNGDCMVIDLFDDTDMGLILIEPFTLDGIRYGLHVKDAHNLKIINGNFGGSTADVQLDADCVESDLDIAWMQADTMVDNSDFTTRVRYRGGDTVDPAITAVGTTQGGYPLNKRFNFVAALTPASAEAVTLPTAPAVGSRKISIHNQGGGTLKIFPATGDTIDDGATNASQDLVDNAGVTYFNVDGTQWVQVSSGSAYEDPLTTRGDLLRYGASASERLALGTSGYVLTSDGTDAAWAEVANGPQPGVPSGSYALIVDQQTSGTEGGATVAGAWTTRVLNTIRNDPDSIVTALSSNKFTLGAGSYIINCTVPFMRSGDTQLRLRNITDSTSDLVGINVYWDTGSDGDGGISKLHGLLTLTAAKDFELQYYAASVFATNGLGRKAAGGGEVENFALVEILLLPGDFTEDSLEDSITAGTTQTQAGATAFTKTINRITVCANASDAVKLPTAKGGRGIEVINDGAQSAAIWPASGDSIEGASVDAVGPSLAAAGRAKFVARNGTDWIQLY